MNPPFVLLLFPLFPGVFRGVKPRCWMGRMDNVWIPPFDSSVISGVPKRRTGNPFTGMCLSVWMLFVLLLPPMVRLWYPSIHSYLMKILGRLWNLALSVSWLWSLPEPWLCGTLQWLPSLWMNHVVLWLRRPQQQVLPNSPTKGCTSIGYRWRLGWFLLTMAVWLWIRTFSLMLTLVVAGWVTVSKG